LGVTTISAVLKKHGHQTEAINTDATPHFPELLQAVQQHQPSVLAVSTCTGQHKWMLEKTQMLKEATGLPVIYGGPHPTFFPEMIEHPGVDVICRSEGEYPMLEFVTALAEGSDYTCIPNLWVKHHGTITRNGLRPNLADLDSLPFSDKELIRPFPHLWKDRVGYFITARGCPYDCTFCYNHAQREIENGPNVRRRSPENVIRELLETKERYGFRYIAFQDDVFLIQNRWLQEFLPLMRDQIRLPFHCHSIANVMRNQDLFQMLADAGCIRIFFAVETGDETLRQKVLKKPVKNSDLFRARDLCERFGIEALSSVMFGLPGETVESALATIEMTIKTRVHCMVIHFFMPYPGTELGDEAVRVGAFDGDFDSLPACDHGRLVTKVNGPPELIEAIGKYSYWFLDSPAKFYFTKGFFKLFRSTSLRMKLLNYFLTHLKPGIFPHASYHLPEPELVQYTIDRLERNVQHTPPVNLPVGKVAEPILSGNLVREGS
jgi:radical SAM superfamily enzyme YgiQ (UPF0313 family)